MLGGVGEGGGNFRCVSVVGCAMGLICVMLVERVSWCSCPLGVLPQWLHWLRSCDLAVVKLMVRRVLA